MYNEDLIIDKYYEPIEYPLPTEEDTLTKLAIYFECEQYQFDENIVAYMVEEFKVGDLVDCRLGFVFDDVDAVNAISIVADVKKIKHTIGRAYYDEGNSYFFRYFENYIDQY